MTFCPESCEVLRGAKMTGSHFTWPEFRKYFTKSLFKFMSCVFVDFFLLIWNLSKRWNWTGQTKNLLHPIFFIFLRAKIIPLKLFQVFTAWLQIRTTTLNNTWYCICCQTTLSLLRHSISELLWPPGCFQWDNSCGLTARGGAAHIHWPRRGHSSMRPVLLDNWGEGVVSLCKSHDFKQELTIRCSQTVGTQQTITSQDYILWMKLFLSFVIRMYIIGKVLIINRFIVTELFN